jgi:hypothetical protein
MRTHSFLHPLRVLAGTVLWGLIEFALMRARLAQRGALAKPRG